jgi:hypothetical protein
MEEKFRMSLNVVTAFGPNSDMMAWGFVKLMGKRHELAVTIAINLKDLLVILGLKEDWNLQVRMGRQAIQHRGADCSLEVPITVIGCVLLVWAIAAKGLKVTRRIVVKSSSDSVIY